MLAVLLVTVGAIAYFRERAFPFTLHCRVSGKLVDAHTFLYRDSNILPEFDESTEDESTENDESLDVSSNHTAENDKAEVTAREE